MELPSLKQRLSPVSKAISDRYRKVAGISADRSDNIPMSVRYKQIPSQYIYIQPSLGRYMFCISDRYRKQHLVNIGLPIGIELDRYVVGYTSVQYLTVIIFKKINWYGSYLYIGKTSGPCPTYLPIFRPLSKNYIPKNNIFKIKKCVRSANSSSSYKNL